MLRFVGDMLIGWIVYTDSGKKMANKIVNKVINNVKKNIIDSPQFKEIASLKDIFNQDEDDNNKGEQNDNQ